jgi:hypothetical protein
MSASTNLRVEMPTAPPAEQLLRYSGASRDLARFGGRGVRGGVRLTQVGSHVPGEPRTSSLRHDGEIRQLATHELEAGLDDVRGAPVDHGRVEMLVLRPTVGERETPDHVHLDVVEGVVGDNWRVRGSSRGPGGAANPEAQVTVMNARMAHLVSGGEADRRKLAGDQIYADLDISHENLPAGSRLRIGSAVIEISAHPHTGCAKFVARFGSDAMRFVNSPMGRQLRLRGVNCKVVSGGVVSVGDTITKEEVPE